LLSDVPRSVEIEEYKQKDDLARKAKSAVAGACSGVLLDLVESIEASDFEC